MAYSRQPLGWTPLRNTRDTQLRPATKASKGLPRLAAALGVEVRALTRAFGATGYNLSRLRTLSLADLQALELRPHDAERLFYLVQWEYLQDHLERHGELPETGKLEPLLATLNPIFIRHFSRSERLNETLIALYRSELTVAAGERCLELTPPSPTSRLLRWLGFA